MLNYDRVTLHFLSCVLCKNVIERVYFENSTLFIRGSVWRSFRPTRPEHLSNKKKSTRLFLLCFNNNNFIKGRPYLPGKKYNLDRMSLLSCGDNPTRSSCLILPLLNSNVCRHFDRLIDDAMSRVRHRKTNGKRRLEVGEKIPRVCCPVLMRIMMFALTVGDYRLNIALKGNNVNPHPPLSFHVKHTEHSNLIAVTSE